MSTDATDVDRLPPAPDVPLSLRERIAAIQVAHSGCETFRDAGGPVTTVRLAPKWMMPPIVAVTSPQGARDILTATGSTLGWRRSRSWRSINAVSMTSKKST